MDALAWKNVVELAGGNSVLVGYLSYIVALLIATAAPKLAKTHRQIVVES
jgi:hypothetical protein